jgi:hypothetical protein
MFPYRVRLRNHELAQRWGKYVRVGEAFVFFGIDPQDEKWMKALARSGEGSRVMSLLIDQVITVPGGEVHPLRLPQLHLDGITTDKAIYRAGRDTVHLLAFGLGRRGEQVAVEVHTNGTKTAELPVHLDHHGVALVPLRDLPAGEYQVRFQHSAGNDEPACAFTVAEYRLAPLVASLVERTWNERSGQLVAHVRLETFGVPVTGGVRVELTDQDERVCEVRAQAVEGLVEVLLRLSGEGPHAINVQLEADPSRTATIPLIGSRAAERSSTLFSTMGATVSGSLLPGEGARPVRRIYLSEGTRRDSPFRLERVDATRARLIATAPTGPVCVVAVDLLTHKQRQEVVRATVSAGEVIEVDVPGPAAVVLVGAFVEGVAWEGWAAVVHPDRWTPRIRVPDGCAPGTDVAFEVDTERPDLEGVVYLVVKDPRLQSGQTPSSCLAGQIKSTVAQLGVERTGEPLSFLDGTSQHSMPRAVGDALVQRGVISAEQLEDVRNLARKTGSHPYHALVTLGYATNEQIMQTLARVLRLRFIDLREVVIPPAIIELLPESVARENVVLPLSATTDVLTVVMSDPIDIATIQKLEFILNKKIQPAVAAQDQIVEAINRHYGQSETECIDSMLAEFTETAIDLPSLAFTDVFPDLEPALTPVITTPEPEVAFAGLLPLHQGRTTATIRVGDGFTDYVAEAFVVSGLDWSAAECRFRAEKDPFVVLDLPAFVHRQDSAIGRVHAGAKSGRMRLRVTCDGVLVPLRDGARQLAAAETLIGTQVVVSLEARPGEYRATVEDLAGNSDQATGRVEEPGKLQSVARSLRFLESGQHLAQDEDSSILALRVLPGLDRPLHSLIDATADYQHLCCEQTAAKIVAGCAMYALASSDGRRRRQAEAVILAGVQREARMWLPGRGFKMYPNSDNQPHSYLGPLAARYLKQLTLLEQMEDSTRSPLLREAITQALKMADDALQAYQVAWPPAAAETCEEAYSVLRFGSGAARRKALDLVRRRSAGGGGSRVPVISDVSFRNGGVLERSEAAYAAAALLRSGDPADRGKAWALADAVLQHIGPEGRLYSTVDSVAAIALLAELRTVGSRGVVEVDGQRLTTTEAAAKDDIRTLVTVTGVTAVEVTRRIVEDWDQLRSTVALRVDLEKDGQSISQFRVGDGLDLHIEIDGGYRDGDLLWVCLPDALSWVLGGAQVKRFAVDLAGESEVHVPLAATGVTCDPAGQPAPQHFCVCLRNMFEEERAGNPGPLQVRVVRAT